MEILIRDGDTLGDCVVQRGNWRYHVLWRSTKRYGDVQGGTEAPWSCGEVKAGTRWYGKVQGAVRR